MISTATPMPINVKDKEKSARYPIKGLRSAAPRFSSMEIVERIVERWEEGIK